jgi:hypothetical protein
LYKVDPRLCILARNLLSKDDWRAALANEVEKCGPKVPLVIKPSSFACLAERLARTGTGPNRSVITESGASKRVAPDADSSEEVTLGISAQVVRSDILNAPFVYIAGRDMPGFYKVAQPLRGVWVNLVVIGGHGLSDDVEMLPQNISER